MPGACQEGRALNLLLQCDPSLQPPPNPEYALEENLPLMQMGSSNTSRR